MGLIIELCVPKLKDKFMSVILIFIVCLSICLSVRLSACTVGGGRGEQCSQEYPERSSGCLRRWRYERREFCMFANAIITCGKISPLRAFCLDYKM